jgi:hypothetical protein
MRLSRLLVIVPSLIAVMPALAQSPPYTTPLYTPQGPAELDKNYGLPAFGMPGTEVPQPQRMTPEAQPPEKPDFFKNSSDFTLPRARNPVSAGSAMETPLYTTSEGPTTGEATTGQFTTGGLTDSGLTTGGPTTGEFTTGGFTSDTDGSRGKANR